MTHIDVTSHSPCKPYKLRQIAVSNKSPASKKAVLGLALFATLGLSACQQSRSDGASNDSSAAGHNTITNQSVSATESTPMSAAVSAHIDSHEAEFVNRMLALQETQMAEFETLKEADRHHSDESAEIAQNDNDNSTLDLPESEFAESELMDLQHLPLVETAVKAPEELTAMEISNRYHVALQSLYLDDDVLLPAKAVDTLLNIATLTPEVFSNSELAERLVVKSPALARMLKQYQTWEQIERQQSAELEAIKQAQLEAHATQEAEFNALVKEFNTTIEEYDAKIQDYEKLLEAMQ